MKTIDPTHSYQTHVFDNGLRLIYTHCPIHVAYCGYIVHAGTRDEPDDEPGIAHFVEHLLFKGTGKRKAWHILNRMEAVGGELNAFTNKEETAIYAAFLSQDTERAIELLTDITFHSTFPQHEIDKEVEVVLDEIQSYEDSPSDLIFDDFESLLFPDHPLGRNILGKESALKHFTTAHAARFTARYYQPSNAVLYYHGEVSFRRVVHMVEKWTARLAHTRIEHLRHAPTPYTPFSKHLQKGTHQAHVIIGTRSYPLSDSRRIGLYLLQNVLGGPGMNSRLNVALREKRGLVYSVEASTASFTDTGLFEIYFGCDEHDLTRCIRLVHHELQQLIDTPLSPTALRAAKKQLLGQIGVATDNFENNAIEMGKIFLHGRQCMENRELAHHIEQLNAHDLQQIAHEVWANERLSTLIYT